MSGDMRGAAGAAGHVRCATTRALGLLVATALALLALQGSQAEAGSGSLTTTFASTTQAHGNTFDLHVLQRKGVVIESFDVNVDPEGGIFTGEVQVWTRPDTAVGAEDSAAGWTSRGSAEVTAQGQDTPTPVPISFSLPQGEYGVAIGSPSGDFDWRYTAGSDTFEDSALRLISGTGLEAPIFGGRVFPDRIWNGTIHYSTPSCEFATQKLKKAKRKVRKAKNKLEQAKASGDPEKIAKAEKKLEKKKKKRRKAKRVKREACT